MKVHRRCRRCGGWEVDHTGRAYCPRCGEVRCAIKRRGQVIVMPHYKRNEQGMANVPCLGGPVDPKEDKAP